MRKLTPVGQEMPGENQSALKIYSRLAAISLIPGLISYSGIVSSVSDHLIAEQNSWNLFSSIFS